MGTPDITAIVKMNIDFVISLYEKYIDDLRKVRAFQKELYSQKGYPWCEKYALYRAVRLLFKKARLAKPPQGGMKPQLDDIEAEITYLLIREYRPQTVVEISPCGGWSTSWILQALKDNGCGKLYSFDLIDDATKNVPFELSDGRWNFYLGDITKAVDKLPMDIDYLFVDSDHSAEFANWYIQYIFSRVKKGCPVSVHDVYHTVLPGSHGSEGEVIIEWLREKGVDYFTPSQAKNPMDFRKLMEVKRRLGINKRIHWTQTNPMIFFEYFPPGSRGEI